MQSGGVLLNGGDPERLALEVTLPRGRCYGSVRSVDVELGLIKPRIIEVWNDTRGIVDQREVVIPGVLDRGVTDQGVFGRGFIDQGIVARGSTDQRITDKEFVAQEIVDEEMVEQKTGKSETFEAGTLLSDPPHATTELPEPDIFETGTSRRGILQPESSTNISPCSITPGDNGLREISQESRYSENCHLAVRRIVQKVTLTGDGITKYQSFLLSHGDQRNEQWRQVKRGHRGQTVVGSNNIN